LIAPKELAGELRLIAKKRRVEVAVDPTLDEEIEIRAVSKNEFGTVKTTESVELPAGGGETIDDYSTIEEDSLCISAFCKINAF